MPPKTKITLSEAQKYELCLYARGNEKTRTEYVNWVENKWGVRVNEANMMRQTSIDQYFMQCEN